MRDDGTESEGEYIYRPWTTTPDGVRIYARNYGLKAFKIPLRKGKPDRR